MNNDVLNFINKFTLNGKRQEVIETFTKGCCYWFAQILCERFYDTDAWNQDVEIVYDQLFGHFGCRIDGKVYDITGDVTNQYQWSRLSDIDDMRFERIFRDCINF